MASMTPGPSSSAAAASSTPSWKYDVFLSFRGEDTRKNFTDHLYSALKQKGINTFRDDEKLERGKTIAPELLKAIEESKFAIVIFSKNYARSTWCLEEASKIADCMKGTGQTVIPIFYHVDPSEVRKQKGPIGEAFAEREVFKDNIEGKVEKWREALRKIANVSGWDLQQRHESDFINEIVENILKRLTSNGTDDEDLVGMDSRVEKMDSYLKMELSDDIRTIGIWGMGGIGKTTLAQEVFTKIKDKFEASCFVANVREEADRNGLRHLQERLHCFLLGSEAKIQNVGMGIKMLRDRLRYIKVLIILDDVDKLDHIEALAGKGGNFGAKGSRIIVTTRDKQLLRKFGEDNICEVDKLSQEEALKLFCKKAFRQNHPTNEFKEKSKEVVKYANGLPLALQVLGSFLFERSEEEWLSTLARLKEYPEKDIVGPLQVSFEGLKKSEKKIFLDIACFFKGENERRVRKILESCGCYPGIDIKVLTEKSLVTIIGEKIWMHDLLQELGQQIVRGESHEEPGKRSRLTLHKDARKVLEKNAGTEAVEGIFFIAPKKEEVHLNVDPFPKMSKLRLLKILNVDFSGSLGYLSDELRLLEWHKYPLSSMPSSFKPENLVELNMSNSCIKQLWTESRDLKKLILINLSNCQFLTKTPDFSMIPNLETLILKGCKTLSEVHSSIGDLQELVLLNLEGCENLRKLPHEISLKSLKTLILSGCSKLSKFPEIVGNMAQLSALYLDGTAIMELPMSIKSLSGLTLLNLKDCKNLSSLPDIICSLTTLKTLMVSGCSRLDQLPENLGNLEYLQEIDASETAIRKVPSSILLLKNLEMLSFEGCKGGHTMQLPNRSWESLFCCCLLPNEGISDCMSLELPDSLSGLFSLRKLDLSRCNIPEGGIPDDLGSLTSLEKLDLSENNFTSIPEISRLPNLRELCLDRCNRLQSLPNLPLSIKYVNARECASLRNSNENTIWISDKGFCIIDCEKSREDKVLNLQKIPIAQEHVYEQLQKFIEDEIYRRKEFGHAFPCTEIPDWCNDNWTKGSSITIELPPELGSGDSSWMGFVLCAVYMIQKQENLDSRSCNLGKNVTEFSCHFETNEGCLENSINFHVPIDCNGGSYGLCKYIPREWFAGQLNKASRIEVSVSANSHVVEVTMCGAHILYEENVTKFVQSLFQPAQADLDFACHYQDIVDHLTKSTYVDEMDCIIKERKIIDREQQIIDKMESVERERESTLAETSHKAKEDPTPLNSFLIHVDAGTGGKISSNSRKSDSTTEFRTEIEALLSRLFQVHYARNFNFACIFPLKAILPWFTYQCVGRLVLCCLPPMLFDDKRWVGFDVYVVLTWDQSVSFDDLDPEFPPFLFAFLHARGRNVRHTAIFSLGKDNLIGSEHRLFVFHVPREHFQEELNQCWQISALFSTTIPEHVEIEMGGIRVVYENDLKGLVQTITECTLESSDANHQRYYQTFENMEKSIFNHAGSTSENNAEEAEKPVAVDLGYFKPSKLVQEDRADSASQQGIPGDSRYPGSQGNMPTDNGHDITGHLMNKYYKGFDSELIYNSCFPPSEIPNGFNHHNDDYSVRIQLPFNSTSESNWIGVALWAYFSENKQPTANIENQGSDIPHYLFCHLETDRGSFEPLFAYQTTNEEFKWLHHAGGFIWLSFLPREWFSNQLKQCSFIEASFGSEHGCLCAHKCGLSLIYDDQEFEPMILHCMKVFWEDWDLMQEILVEKDIMEGSFRHLGPTFIILDIIVEAFFESHYSITEWKRNLKHLLEKFFKVSLVITLSLNGCIISMLRGFEPNFRYNFCFPRKEIPEWFNFQVSSPVVNVQLGPDLFNESWLGFAICVAFSVHENPTTFLDSTGSEIPVSLLCHFRINEHCLNSMFRISKEEFKWKHIGGFIWLTYIPRWSFPDFLNQQSQVEIKIHTSSPGLAVQNCGIHLLYKQNLEQFLNTIIKCLTSFFDDLDPIFEYLKDNNRNQPRANKWETNGTGSKVEPQDKRYREPTCDEENNETDSSYVNSDQHSRTLSEELDSNQDSKCSSYENQHNGEMRRLISQGASNGTGSRNKQPNLGKCDLMDICFPPTEILEWFRKHNEGPSVKIELPSKLSYDDNWIGLALCAYFSDPDHQHPMTSIDNLKIEETSHHLFCHLQTDKSSLGPHVYQTTNEEFKWLQREGRFVWISFIPRAWFSDQLNQCSSMEASFISDRGSLCVQKCGLRLVFQHNEKEFRQTIEHCMTPLLENQQKRLEGPNDTNGKGKEKLVLE